MACKNHPDSTSCPMQIAESAAEAIALCRSDSDARTIAIEAMRQMVNHPLSVQKPKLDLTHLPD